MKKNTRDNSALKLKIKNNRRLYIKVTSIALSIVLLVGTIIYFAFARYESTKDFSLINAKVGVYGDIVIAAVVDGQSQASFPDKSTYKLQGVECKDSNNNTITSMYDTNTWGMYIPEVNGKTKCTYTFTTNTVTEHSLNPTTATGDAYSGSSGNLNGSSTLTTSTPLNISDYVQNNQYHFNLGGGEQITFPSGFYSSPINVSNGGTLGGNVMLIREFQITHSTFNLTIPDNVKVVTWYNSQLSSDTGYFTLITDAGVKFATYSHVFAYDTTTRTITTTGSPWGNITYDVKYYGY